MGRDKDKLYTTAKEHAASEGGYRSKSAQEFARLPLNCCSLSFSPWATPVCSVTASGDAHIFDLLSIVPYLRSHGNTSPIDGAPLSTKDLVRLKFHKNPDGELACPVTGTRFGDHTRVVALRTTGHVYAGNAIETLCVARRVWRDLLDDSPFSRADIMVLQDVADPAWLASHRTGSFKSREGGAARPQGAAVTGSVIRVDEALRSILSEYSATQVGPGVGAGAGAGAGAGTGTGTGASAGAGAGGVEAAAAPGRLNIAGIARPAKNLLEELAALNQKAPVAQAAAALPAIGKYMGKRPAAESLPAGGGSAEVDAAKRARTVAAADTSAPIAFRDLPRCATCGAAGARLPLNAARICGHCERGK